MIAKEAREYVDICTNECLAPLSKDIPAGPPLIPFLQTLSSLLKNDNSDIIIDNTASEQTKQAQAQQPMPEMAPESSDSGYVQPDALPNRVDSGSWLLNGGAGGNPALSQAAWQQLFSSAGTPFSNNDNSNRSFDVQGNNVYAYFIVYFTNINLLY
jgi:hypothetical protein